jgi:hypothetical protein
VQEEVEIHLLAELVDQENVDAYPVFHENVLEGVVEIADVQMLILMIQDY